MMRASRRSGSSSSTTRTVSVPREIVSTAWGDRESLSESLSVSGPLMAYAKSHSLFIPHSHQVRRPWVRSSDSADRNAMSC